MTQLEQLLGCLKILVVGYKILIRATTQSSTFHQ